MFTPNTDVVPVTRHSEAAKVETGVRLNAANANMKNRMPTSDD